LDHFFAIKMGDIIEEGMMQLKIKIPGSAGGLESQTFYRK